MTDLGYANYVELKIDFRFQNRFWDNFLGNRYPLSLSSLFLKASRRAVQNVRLDKHYFLGVPHFSQKTHAVADFETKGENCPGTNLVAYIT